MVSRHGDPNWAATGSERITINSNTSGGFKAWKPTWAATGSEGDHAKQKYFLYLQGLETPPVQPQEESGSDPWEYLEEGGGKP